MSNWGNKKKEKWILKIVHYFMKYLNATIKNNIKPIPKSKKGLIKELIRSEIIIKPTMFKVIDIKRIIVK